MNNFKKVVTMVLAFAMVLTCVMVTPAQAAGKLNKATASIYAGETVQLKAKVKSVTWGSSNKKVAKVSKTGLVTGVKKGTCTITAKDNKTKTAYKCKVTVKAAKNFGFKAKDIFLDNNRVHRSKWHHWLSLFRMPSPKHVDPIYDQSS